MTPGEWGAENVTLRKRDRHRWNKTYREKKKRKIWGKFTEEEKEWLKKERVRTRVRSGEKTRTPNKWDHK